MVKLEHSFQEIHSVQWLRNHLIKKFLKKKLRVSDVLLCVKKKKKTGWIHRWGRIWPPYTQENIL